MTVSPARRRRRRAHAALLGLAVTGSLLGAVAVPATAAAPGDDPPGRGVERIRKAPVDRLSTADLSRRKESRLVEPKGATTTATLTASAGSGVDPLDLRVLLLATKGSPNPDGVHAVPAGSWDWNLSTLTGALDHAGTPYDTLKSTTRQLCVNGTWELQHAVHRTDTVCTSGTVVDWGAVTAGRLQRSSSHAAYSGVMQTNGTLSYVDAAGAFVPSALTAEEWAALWTFEARFGVRTVSANTYPTADFGLAPAGEDGEPRSARWTAAGAAAFPYVNAAGSLPISDAWVYRATVDPADTTTVPLLTDADGSVLAVVKTYPEQGGREALALTFDSAAYQTHGQVLGYGLVSWVTKGLFLGERRAYLDPQPDDVFIADSIWAGPHATCENRPDDPRLPQYRMTGDDLTKVLTWQRAKQAQPVSKALTLELPFNGEGTTAAYLAEQGIARDTLTPVAKKNQSSFKWVNHTFSHQNMDFQAVPDAQVSTTNGVSRLTSATVGLSNGWGQTVAGTGIAPGTTVVDVSTDGRTVTLSSPATASGAVPDATVGTTYAQATSQITRNHAVAAQLGLTAYAKENLVQPDISGLTNRHFLSAARDAGVKYVISDTSRTGDPATYGVNEGRYNALDGAVYEVARYPVNLYFNVSTPAEWLAEDNCLYPAGAPFGHVSTYAELLDRESDVLLRYLLQGHNRPLMFHQPNLRAYDGRSSVLGDLLDATLAKYGALVTVPVLSPTQDQLGQRQLARSAYNRAWKTGGLSATVVPGRSVTVTSRTAVTVPITGLNPPKPYTSELYAGQRTASVPLAPGQSVTLPLR